MGHLLNRNSLTHADQSILNMPISTISSLSAATPTQGSNGNPGTSSSSRSVDPRNLSFDKMETMEQIIVRQLNEDIRAYNFDIDFCNNQMKSTDITPQEMRTLQLRLLDLTHSLRHSQHRIERLQHEVNVGNGGGASASASMGKALPYSQTTEEAFSTFPRPDGAAVKRPGAPLPAGATKRTRASNGVDAVKSESSRQARNSSPGTNSSFFDDADDEEMQRTILHGNNNLQRLGYWKCRLCTSAKYVASKNIRQPAQPCKWALKDVAKMIAHYTELHTEHEPNERCIELGRALSRNRKFCLTMHSFSR